MHSLIILHIYVHKDNATTRRPANLRGLRSTAKSISPNSNSTLSALTKTIHADICQPGDHASKPHTFTSRETMRMSLKNVFNSIFYIYTYNAATRRPAQLRGPRFTAKIKSNPHLGVRFRCSQGLYRRISANLAITQVNLIPSRQGRRREYQQTLRYINGDNAATRRPAQPRQLRFVGTMPTPNSEYTISPTCSIPTTSRVHAPAMQPASFETQVATPSEDLANALTYTARSLPPWRSSAAKVEPPHQRQTRRMVVVVEMMECF